MAEEIELKLALPESAHRRFLRSPVLRDAVSRHSGRLINIYYDTPALELRDKAIALRLRRAGKVWLQTVKCAAASAGGLSSRPEWENPYGGHFDFSAIDNAKVRAWLNRPKVRDRLAPVFETNFLRTTWRFEPAPGTTLLLMFDRGWIVAAGRHEAISEVEIELAGGDLDELFALAGRLAERLPLAPAIRSKAERGYLLYQGLQPSPAKAEPLVLSASLSPPAAFTRIALSCLRQIELNHAGAISSDDPEYIHQMRVGTRRLRAALRLFAPCLPASATKDLLPFLRKLMKHLGHARDLDVLLADIIAPALAAQPDEPRLAVLAGLITDRRHSARSAAIQALLSPAYGQLMLRLSAITHSTMLHAPVDKPVDLSEFANRRLRHLHKAVRGLAANADPNNIDSLHALRIGLKRLRYAIEFFVPLSPSKVLRHFTRRLAAAQDALGQLNDLANAGRLFVEYAGEDTRLREAIVLVGYWHRPRQATLTLQVPLLVKRLRKLPPQTLA